MTTIEKYNKTFIEAFNIKEHELPKLTYQSIQAWDSVGHMNLIASIEEIFDIMMDTDDIVDLNSYEKGIEILKKYDIEI